MKLWCKSECQLPWWWSLLLINRAYILQYASDSDKSKLSALYQQPNRANWHYRMPAEHAANVVPCAFLLTVHQLETGAFLVILRIFSSAALTQAEMSHIEQHICLALKWTLCTSHASPFLCCASIYILPLSHSSLFHFSLLHIIFSIACV